jgi:hypothetical protein
MVGNYGALMPRLGGAGASGEASLKSSIAGSQLFLWTGGDMTLSTGDMTDVMDWGYNSHVDWE